jgi:undecaprenyl-diphosphatase
VTRAAPSPLIAALVIAGLAVLAFVGSLVAARGGPFDFDRAIMLGLRNAADPARPIGPPWLRETMIDLTALGGVTVLTTVVALVTGLLLVRRLWLTAGLVVAATLSGSIVAAQAKFWVGRPRPELVDHLVQVTGLSFPSGHATNSAIVYLTLASLLVQVERGRAVRRYTFAIAILLVGTIGVSRVYLGVHWPSDVLAGWTLGALWATGWWWIGARLRAR